MKLSNAYTAGLFDGEGWFSISRSRGSLYRHRREFFFQCQAGLVMREEMIVQALAETFGGTVRQQKRYSKNHSYVYRWRITGKNVLEFAETLQSLLIAKRAQAEMVIAFQKEKTLNGNQPLPDSRYDFYCYCYNHMSELNRKGVNKSVKDSVKIDYPSEDYPLSDLTFTMSELQYLTSMADTADSEKSMKISGLSKRGLRKFKEKVQHFPEGKIKWFLEKGL